MGLFIPCSVPELTELQKGVARERAKYENPIRAARWPTLLTPGYLAVDMRRWWTDKGKTFTVAFDKQASKGLRELILAHANEWSKYANVKFVASSIDPMIRIAFGNSGYWSYLGTDILGIPGKEPTMNLQGFTENSSDAECRRVIRHEFGHTLGFPHEHMRPELVALLDQPKTIAYFKKTQGWSAQEVRDQVLTALDKASIRGTVGADDTSIMCYQLPGSITKNGKPIRGGDDINATDAKFIATIYPKDGEIDPVDPGVEGEDWVRVVLTTKEGLEFSGKINRTPAAVPMDQIAAVSDQVVFT